MSKTTRFILESMSEEIMQNRLIQTKRKGCHKDCDVSISSAVGSLDAVSLCNGQVDSLWICIPHILRHLG